MNAEHTPTVRLSPIVVPKDVDGPDAADFRVMVDLRNRINAVVRGEQAIGATAAQTLPPWQDQTDELIHGFLILADDAPVGRALLYVPLEQGSRIVDIRVEVLPERWGRGIGRVAIAYLERLARSLGRSVARGWTDHLDLGGERIAASTGFGSVPDDHIARTMRAAGYALEQVYRTSAIDHRSRKRLTHPTGLKRPAPRRRRRGRR